jgi:streptogramin lyase
MTSGSPGTLHRRLAAWILTALAAAAGPLAGQTFTQFPLTPGSGPKEITLGPDGNLWFAEWDGDRIGRMTPGGVLTEFVLPIGTRPIGVTVGPDNAIWFTEHGAGYVTRMDLTGAITHRYPGSVATTFITGSPVGLTTGADGNLWFVEHQANFVGRIVPGTPTGTPATMYAIPDAAACPLAQCGPYGITSGPDGNLWFTQEQGNRIGVISTAGVFVKQIPLSPTVDAAQPLGIIVGPDGNLWFSMYSPLASGVGTLPATADGPEDVTAYLTPPPYAGKRSYRLVVGSDLAIWFTIPDGNALGRITASGTFSFFPGPAPPDDLQRSYALALGPDRDLWLTEFVGHRVDRFEIDCVAKVPTLVAADAEICPGESLSLTATPPLGLTYVAWQFYRDATLVQDSASDVFTVPSAALGDTGSYTVTGTTAEACVSNPSTPAVVTVDAPTVTASGGDVCFTGATVTLTATPADGSGNYTSYQWFREGSSISGANSATYDAIQVGSYTVIVTDDNLCTSAQSAPTVLRPLPTVTVSPPSSATFCGGSSILLTANPAGGSGSFPSGGYQWSLGGVAIGGANANTYAASAAGSYTVTVTDSTGCMSVESPATVLTELPQPAVTISGDNTICWGETSVLTADVVGGTGPFSYQWSLAGSPVGGNTPTLNATATGSYTVVVTDSNTCASNPSPAFPLTVSHPTVTISGDNAICWGETSVLTADVVGGTGPFTYQWSLAGSPVGGNTPTLNATAAGNYTVLVTDANGCASDSSPAFPLAVNPVPAVTISGDNAICWGETSVLTADVVGGTGPFSYQWSLAGSPVGNTPTLNATAAGSYTVVVTDANACPSGPSPAFSLTVAPLPNASITTAATVCALSNGTASVVDAGPGASYAWTVTNGTITGGQGTFAITYKAGSGTVQISVMIMASSGCSATGNASVSIDTLCSGPLFFYTVEPCRLVDTRGSDAPALAPGETREFVVAGSCAVPTTARSISANVTVTGPTAPGFLRLWATGTPMPATSWVNFNAAQTRANNAMLALAPDGSGRVSVRNISTGTVHAILDTNGYFE